MLGIFLLNICMDMVLAPKDFIAKISTTDDHLLIDSKISKQEEFVRQEEIQKVDVTQSQILESDFN